MSNLWFSEEFEDSLDEIWLEDPMNAAYLDALLDELQTLPELLNCLNQKLPKFLLKPPVEIKLLESGARSNRWIYIVKPYDEDGALLPYRVLLGHEPRKDIYVALAALKRADAYDANNQRFINACELYDRLCHQ